MENQMDNTKTTPDEGQFRSALSALSGGEPLPVEQPVAAPTPSSVVTAKYSSLPENLSQHRYDVSFFGDSEEVNTKLLPSLEWGKSFTRKCVLGNTVYQVTQAILNPMDFPTPEAKYRQCLLEVYTRMRNITSQWGEYSRLEIDAEVAQLKGEQALKASKDATLSRIDSRLLELEACRQDLEAKKCGIGMSDIRDMVLVQCREIDMLRAVAEDLERSGAMTDQHAYAYNPEFEEARANARLEHEQNAEIEQMVRGALSQEKARGVLTELSAARTALTRGVVKPGKSLIH